MNAMAVNAPTTGRMVTGAVPRNTTPTTKAHLRKVHTALTTTVRANCGCGWTCSTTDPNQVEQVISEAFEHRHVSGHVIDIHGILR